jgi:hypothetical protein
MSQEEDRKDLYGVINDDLRNRSKLEARQSRWLAMRDFGLKRLSKPWAGAADMHIPIGDTVIGKLKAYYVQWIFGPELLASFYSLSDQGDSYADSVAQWFNYQVRERSNFSIQSMVAIDSILQNGLGFVKTYWDTQFNCLSFQSVAPYYIIVPSWTSIDPRVMDRMVQVIHYSKDQYKRAAKKRGLNTDKAFIDSVTGSTKPDPKYEEMRYNQDGITYSHGDMILYWEIYERQDDGSILVKSMCPSNPAEPPRDDFKLPYRHKQFPITRIGYEITDEGFYSSRGVMELVQMYEMSATKMWNEKLDYMSIANRPILSTQGGSINAQNIRWEPGGVYDVALQVVQQPPPPVSFDEEMQSTRSLAEQRVGIPDFGVGQDNQVNKPRTATEVNSIATVMQQSNDLRARVLKDGTTNIFEQAWSILLQYEQKSLDYFWRGQRITLPDAALDDCYQLEPNGSVDGYSRERDIQKLMQLRQLANGSPWLKVYEIDRKIVELMDSQWINQVYEPPQQVDADQQMLQATENATMMDGFGPQVKPTDEHVTHLKTIDGYLGWTVQNARPIPPDIMTIFMQHGLQHIEAARADAGYMKLHAQEIAQFAQKIQATQKQLAQQQQMVATQPPVGGPPGGAPPPMAPPPNGAMPPPNGAPPTGGLPAPPPPPQPGVTPLTPAMPPGGPIPNPASGSRFR